MADWLKDEGVTQVAMESTGVYWKPIFNINILEGESEVLLVKAQKLKHVPGHKADAQDCQWIAQLLQYGAPQLKGETRTVRRFRAIAYPIARKSAASYFPEANALVPVGAVAPESNQPAHKCVRITLRASESPELAAGSEPRRLGT